MDVIDDQGRLFGLINIIDVFVVLIVVAVVVAGAALVLQSNPESDLETTTQATPETTTTTAILDLGPQPEYVVNRIKKGDTYSPAENSNLTVSDVYIAPQQDDARVVLAVDLESPVPNGTPSYAGAPLRIGRQLTVQTPTYEVSGTIRVTGYGFDRQTTRVLVEQAVDARTANAIQAGDTYTLAGREIAAVESVHAFATRNPDRRRIHLGLTIHTVDLGSGLQFGSITVRRGATLSFQTPDGPIYGTIERVGSSEPRGEPATREVTLELNGVPPEIASSLRSGMSETVAGNTNARVTAVDTQPAPVISTTDDGQVITGEHPFRKQVTLTAELSVRDTATGPTFKGRSLQLGRTVDLDLGTVTIEATVSEIGD